ncbi:unnamed protein product [Adineta ricciae]|uniref:Cytochrome P450 n=1 Tax=Adineta ricciae TaxID=249248 RepID=A0A813UAP2_ADIRI|nr:unnamed protein product [Adineta ricciae]
MLCTIVLLTCFLCLIITYLWKTNHSYGYFKRHGIQTPPYRFFFGHYKDLWATKSFSITLQQWTKKYGSIYGLFLGTKPMYVVSNVDFLQEIYIKQFSSFHSRHLPIILRLQTGHKVHLFSAIGARWRRQRHVINPTFTSGKMKLMSSLVSECIETMTQKIFSVVQSQPVELNIYQLYKRMTMDVICRCAFGIDTDMQNDTENIYLKKSAGAFELDIDQLLIVKLTNLLPIFIQPFRYFYLFQIAIRRALIRFIPFLKDYIEETPGSWLTNRVRDVVNLRKQSPTKRIDLLQLMIDASTDGEVKDNVDEQLMPKVLHTDEVISNVFLFMIAGYETTSTALAYSTYVLATKPLIQQRLRKEIDQIDWKDGNKEATYDLAVNLPYLDLFIREVLRMYPVGTKGLTRECNTTTTVCGHTIEKGSIIQPDVFTIHYNPELWGPEDPNIFYPERHAEKRHPAAWMPFGIGPRSCIGIRFALMELKMCLIRLLGEYEILASDRIEEGFRREERLVIQPDAIYVKLKKCSTA